jgi:hypothetical protein
VLLLALSIIGGICGSAFAQSSGAARTPVIGAKYSYAGVTATATGNLWSAAQSSLNYSNMIVHWVAANSPSTCTLVINTGPTAATATLAVDDPNHSITCTSSGQHVVSALDNYFNINVSAISGSSAAVTVYVTLTNFAANALNQTISTAAQGTASASQYWLVEPGNGTNPEKHVLDGVGGQGAGVLQTAELFTLSSAVASATLTQVAAAPSSGSLYLGRLLVEKATASTGSVTVEYGTGTNCGTGTTVIFGPVTVPPVGMMSVGILVPATKALCLVTDASTTSVRALTQ